MVTFGKSGAYFLVVYKNKILVKKDHVLAADSVEEFDFGNDPDKICAKLKELEEKYQPLETFLQEDEADWRACNKAIEEACKPRKDKETPLTDLFNDLYPKL